MSETFFSVENLKVSYPHSRSSSQWAIDDISFSLQPGEKIGFVGESGCGKSTLGRAIMRLLPKGSQIAGNITFNHQSVLTLSSEELRHYRGEVVGLIFQDPMTRLDPLMTIGEHCIETLKAHQSNLSDKEAKTKAIETLETVKIPASRWSQFPHEFSGGMRQRVAIALALLVNPKLIIADEPTTSLDVTVSASILQELTRLCADRNMGLILISHDLAMVGEYCDRLAVMYNGKIVETGNARGIFKSPQHDYTKSLLNAALHIQAVDENYTENINLHSDNNPQKPLLKLTDLQQHYTLEKSIIEQIFNKEVVKIKAVDEINLELYPGEILGLVGESGCGKSTLSRTILQLIKPTGGKVEFLGQEISKMSRKEIQPIRKEMQMIFQDPHACLNPMMTIGQSIADPLFIHNMTNKEDAKKQVEKMLEKVGLTPVEEFLNRYPSELSGGQQQRVAIARALITRPKMIICDEPVSMLDASVQTQVLDLILALKEEFNLTYLFITHDLWVARFLCDRIAVMKGGKIVEIGETEKIFRTPEHEYTKTLLQAAPLLAKL